MVFLLLIEKGHSFQIAAFIAEPVMGAGGVILPPKTYFEKVKIANSCFMTFLKYPLWFYKLGCNKSGFWYFLDEYMYKDAGTYSIFTFLNNADSSRFKEI